jgi:chromosome segregation ATPase
MTDEEPVRPIAEAQAQLSEFSQTIFTDLQHDFHELNHEIQKDSPVEPFRREYAKLFGILQKSMTNQARYIDKCRVLESEIVGNKAKVRTVSKLSEEDSRSIANLNDDRNRKQVILQENQALLARAMEENNQVSQKITELENELEECVSNERGQKDLIKQLKSRRTELTREFEDLGAQIPEMQDANKQLSDKLAEKDAEIEASLADLKRIDETLEQKQREGQQEQQRLLELERDREATRVRLKDALQNVKDRTVQLSTQQEALKQLERRLRDQKRRCESAKSEKQEMNERVQKAQRELAGLNQQIAAMEEGIAKAKNELDERVNLAAKMQTQAQEQEAEREKVRQAQQVVQETYEAVRKETDAAKATLDKTELEIEELQRQGEFLRRQIDAVTREQNAKLKQNQGEMQKKNHGELLLEVYRNQSHNIDCEVAIIKNHIQEIQQKIFAVENDREHYSAELAISTSQWLHAQDVLKEIDSKVAAKNQEIAATERKARQQQALYETVRGEREVASKKVKEVQAEIEQLKHGFDRMKFTIEQNKDDIRRKDKERIIDLRDLDNVNLEESRLREKLTEVQIDARTAQRAILAHDGELSKLDQTLKDAEAQLKLDEQKVAEVKKERDHMSNQNVEREKELKEMDDRLAVLKNQCRRGERDYDAKESEIARIRGQLEADQAKLNELSRIDVEMKERREEIHRMQKELLTLKAERAAMEEELQIPINIHRWTLLESTDPARFEKLKRYQELQGDLVMRTKEVQALQDQIKEKEAEYHELQVQLRRRPGIEAEQRVQEYKGQAKSERLSLDQITAQLEVYRDVVKEYRKELANAQSDLLKQRNKWIQQKRKDMKQKHALQEQQRVLDDLGISISLGSNP